MSTETVYKGFNPVTNKSFEIPQATRDAWNEQFTKIQEAIRKSIEAFAESERRCKYAKYAMQNLADQARAANMKPEKTYEEWYVLQ